MCVGRKKLKSAKHSKRKAISSEQKEMHWMQIAMHRLNDVANGEQMRDRGQPSILPVGEA